MFAKFNILKFLRMAVVFVPFALALSSCSKDSSIEDVDKTDEEMADEMQGCWQEGIIDPLYKVMGETTMGMYTKVTDGAMAVVMIGFAIWFALRLLKFTGSIAEDRAMGVWNEVLRKLFVCLFCGVIASSTDNLLYLLNTFVFPIYNAFLELGGKILAEAVKDENVVDVKVLGYDLHPDKTILCQPVGNSAASLSGFPDSTLSMMKCMICAVNQRLTLGYAIAVQVARAPGFLSLINALLLIITFTIVKVSFVFYLIDNIFKFAVMIIMLPILVMMYPFKPGWARFGFKTIMVSSAFMMSIAVMIAMALMAVIEIIQLNPSLFNPDDPQAHVNELSAVMVALLLISFLIVGTIKVAQTVTSAVVGNAESKFQEKLKGVAMMALSIFTGGVAGMIGKIGMVQRMSNRYQNSAFGKAMQKRREVMDKVNKWAGRS